LTHYFMNDQLGIKKLAETLYACLKNKESQSDESTK